HSGARPAGAGPGAVGAVLVRAGRHRLRHHLPAVAGPAALRRLPGRHPVLHPRGGLPAAALSTPSGRAALSGAARLPLPVPTCENSRSAPVAQPDRVVASEAPTHRLKAPGKVSQGLNSVSGRFEEKVL